MDRHIEPALVDHIGGNVADAGLVDGAEQTQARPLKALVRRQAFDVRLEEAAFVAIAADALGRMDHADPW